MGDINPTEVEVQQLVKILKGMNCIPIFIDKTLEQGHYHGYCKQILWPLFHNVDQIDSIHSVWKLTVGKYGGARGRTRTTSAGAAAASSPANATADSTTIPPPPPSTPASPPAPTSHPPDAVIVWNANLNEYYTMFQSVNRIFADVLLSLMRAGDVVWVHDYHLMLLPKLLRDSPEYAAIAAKASIPGSSACSADGIRIIFFLHIPFPTSQIFRSLPQANELLISLACADVIGFHAFDYTRHFLNAIKRMLGLKSRTRPGGLLSFFVSDREVSLLLIVLCILKQ